MMNGWRVPVIRIRATKAGTDRYREPIPGEVERERLPPALFDSASTGARIASGVHSIVTEPAVHWPREWPDIVSGDSLEIDGGVWLVHERPRRTPLGLIVTVKGVDTAREAT